MTASIIVIYLAIGAVLAVFSAFYMGPRALKLADKSIDRVVGLASFQRQFKKGLLSRLRWIITYRFLFFPVFVVAWPVTVAYMRRAIISRDYRERTRAVHLAPVNLQVALALFGFALLLLVLRILVGPGWAIDTGSAFLLVALIANLISNSLSALDLPGQLRRNLMQPYVQFIAIAALQYLTLLSGSLLLGPLQVGGKPTLDVVVDQIKGLGAFTHVFDVVLGTPRTPSAILLTLAGICLFAMIGKVLFQYRKFIRQPADHATIVATLSALGRIEDARRWLDKLDAQGFRDGSLLGARLMVLIGENEHEKAYSLAEAQVVLRTGDDGPRRDHTVDDVLVTLLTTSSFMSLQTGQHWQLVRFAVRRGISDGCLAAMIWPLCEDLEIDQAGQLAGIGISYESHPITHSTAAWLLAGDSPAEDEARARLAAAQPVSDTDKIARAMADCRIRIFHRDDVAPAATELLDLITAAGDLPAWCRPTFGVGVDELVASRLLGRELQERARQCERALYEGLGRGEVEIYNSLKAASRILSGQH
ncbi:hypothetical protein [Amycolatopsis vancoresmycina]|uniref:hypothetical protein n=1 Tax=Amycolatopsis vancoresmycina TaxID=208444 RepID=UPI0012DD6F8F|nr:hypothetical protein [Amycolatopsis vancoresmycina]